jgi:type IV pilus assembly protein PilP
MIKTRTLASLLACSLTACAGSEFADLKQFVNESGREMTGRIEPLPAMKPYEPFAYVAFDLPDPFKPRKITPAKSGGGLQPDLNRRKEPLEAYPLENLKMVGTLNRGRNFFALIKTPDNTLARIRNGNYLGQNFGHVLEVTESQVKLKEVVQDTAGDWSERISTLQLQDEQEQKK